MELIEKIKKLKKGIRLPKGIIFDLQDQTLNITVLAKGVVSNMQTNDSAFEGWCICLKALLPEDIKEVNLDWQSPSITSSEKEKIHYNRFLLRVSMFKNFFDWFIVAPTHEDEVSSFEQKHTDLVVNYPITDSKKQVAKSDKINKGEAELEREICGIMQQRGYIANHQLPVGLFDEFAHTKQTCTPRSASQIDLWSLSNNELNIYELKDKDNNSVGIISELMFYAYVMNQIRKHKINYPEQVASLPNPKRNILELYNAIECNQINRINAIFLTFKLHPLIEDNRDNVLSLLNQSMNQDGIFFSFESVDDYKETR